ncbi:GNAT family acetyltransferase Nat4 [Phyllosticta capitalensis]
MPSPSLKRKFKQLAKNEELINKINSLPQGEFHQRFFGSNTLLSYKEYDISLKPILDMNKIDLNACLELIEKTSLADYKASERGWKPKHKLDEMHEDNMQYLLVRQRPDSMDASGSRPKTLNGDSKPADDKEANSRPPEDQGLAGFVSFMFTIEDDYPVVYIYEIHLDESHRGCGLGRHLMDAVEHCACEGKVDKVMLTCFRRNTTALEFYTKVGFREDEFSPPPKRLRGGKLKYPSYTIMSKSL